MVCSLFKFILFFSFVNLVSCAPRDSHVENLKERLMAGELVLFDKPGERLPTCFEDENDWQDLRIHEKDYESFVLHQLVGTIQNGYKNCQRVGNRVFVNNDKIKSNGSLGWAEITGIALVRLDSINKNVNKDLKDYEDKKKLLMNNKVVTNFDETVLRLVNKAEPKDQGVVHITMFKYISGSSTLESQIKAKYAAQNDLESQLNKGHVFSLKEVGKKLPSCSSDEAVWTDFRINSGDFVFIKESKIKTIIKKGIKNCHVIGQVIPINSKGLEGDLGKVKITELTLLSLDSLKKQRYLVQGEVAINKFDEDIQRLAEQMEGEKNKLVNLTYIEYLGVE